MGKKKRRPAGITTPISTGPLGHELLELQVCSRMQWLSPFHRLCPRLLHLHADRAYTQMFSSVHVAAT